MKNRKGELLEAHGWKVGNTQDFLSLTEEEQEYIDIKIALTEQVRKARQHRNLTQKEAARLIGSSQSRVAKIEAGDPSVSIDLQVKLLLALGVTREDLGEAIKPETAAA